METALPSPNPSIDVDKPRAPRFEAYVMTGDAILNLSRTTHSPEYALPVHSKRRSVQQQPSSSVPTSPSEQALHPTKPWEPETPAKTPVSTATVRSSKSEEALVIHMEEEKSKKNAEERTSSQSSLGEGITETERIVWTYNAPLSSMTEKELRRYEADQFWLSTRTESSSKQTKQIIKVEETKEVKEEHITLYSCEVADTRLGCDTQNGPTVASKAIIQEPMKLEQLEVESNGEIQKDDDIPANSSVRPPLARTPTDEESDADSLQSVHYSPKGVDMPSAIRLAKRLYSLDGFQKSDVSRHLSKNNDFNRTVAEEYLKHFDFEGTTLDVALRRFLQAFQLTGESSERDRVLVHFSRRYLQSNPDSFSSQDGVHILTCALLLLNSDLHGKHQGMKRMTCAQFIKRLSGLNDGGNFPVDLLRRLYTAIKDQPLEWASDSPQGPSPGDLEPLEIIPSPAAKELSVNPYLDIPNPTQSQEFKKGYIMRKCCMEPNGKRTPLGKRSWRMYFAVLKDLVLYLYKDEATCKGEHPPKSSTMRSNKAVPDAGPAALLRVHHSLAASAPDYTKKKNVFRLFTADRAQYLIQASDTKEWRCWMDALNTAASLLSSPPLAAPCGSQQRFQRPLLPASLTKLSAREQLSDHEERVAQLEQDLHEHRANPPSSKAKSVHVNCYREKDAYLHFEKTRYEAYIAVCGGLQAALAGSTVSRDISLLELDESPCSDSGTTSPDLKLNDQEFSAHL